MIPKIPCSRCAQSAVAELFEMFLCPGCLMGILTSEDKPLPIRKLSVSKIPTESTTPKARRSDSQEAVV